MTMYGNTKHPHGSIKRILESNWLIHSSNFSTDGIGSLGMGEHLVFPYMVTFGTPYLMIFFSFIYENIIFEKKSQNLHEFVPFFSKNLQKEVS